MRSRPAPRAGVAGVVALVLVVAATLLVRQVSGGSPAPTTATQDAGGTVSAAQLPVEARRTLTLLDRGGPFPYARDGIVFDNREGVLPDERRGCYHEYTVKTPGESDRGARRIITSCTGARYWTADHYETFALIRAG